MPAAAAALAAQILSYLAEDANRLTRFLDLTGLNPQTLRQAAAAEADFTTNLVEYLASDERLLLAFAAETGRDPAEIDFVRRSLAPPIDHGDL